MHLSDHLRDALKSPLSAHVWALQEHTYGCVVVNHYGLRTWKVDISINRGYCDVLDNSISLHSLFHTIIASIGQHTEDILTSILT